MARNVTFIFIYMYTNWKLIIEKKNKMLTGNQLLMFRMIYGFRHDLARFEKFARAHCPVGSSDLIHFVI